MFWKLVNTATAMGLLSTVVVVSTIIKEIKEDHREHVKAALYYQAQFDMMREGMEKANASRVALEIGKINGN